MINTSKPLFHSKFSIVLFTLLLSSFFGSLLYSQNLKEVGKKKDIASAIIFGLLWNLLCSKLLTSFSVNNSTVRLFLPNIIAGFIFITGFWNYHFKGVEAYNKRKIWIPLIIVILVYGLLISLNILTAKK